MCNNELKLLDKMKNEIDEMQGHLGFYYKNVESGLEYGVREDEAFLAASVIKLPLLLSVMNECEKGKMSMNDVLAVGNEEKFPGCGALKMFTDKIDVDIKTLCKLMICISDNTATNKLISILTLEGVEKCFAELGLEKTKIRRFLFDSVASSKGIENTISPKEMGVLLEKLHKGEFIDKDKSKDVIDILLSQQINHKMGGKLKGCAIAHKTGEDHMLSNDVGIVYGDSPFILCFAGHDTDVYLWEDFMRRYTYELYCENKNVINC